jgi:hypothetical protein
MRVLWTLSALLYVSAGFADDLYLSCTYSDGLHTKLAFLSNGSGLTFREGSMLIEDGKTDEFGGSGRVSQTPSALEVEYRQSWQLVQSVVRSGVQTYRNAQCALSQP